MKGLNRKKRVQCLATWGSTGLSFCPGHIADVCIHNFGPLCPPALHTVQEVKEKAGLLSGCLIPYTGTSRAGVDVFTYIEKRFLFEGKGEAGQGVQLTVLSCIFS